MATGATEADIGMRFGEREGGMTRASVEHSTVKTLRTAGARLRSDAAVFLELLAPARDVLFVGRLQPDILNALNMAGCNVSCLLTGGDGIDHAAHPKATCRVVWTLPEDALVIPTAVTTSLFDGVLLYDVLNSVKEPLDLLSQLRGLLRNNGPLVGALNRLQDDSVFRRAGFVVERVVKGTWTTTDSRRGAVPQAIFKAVPANDQKNDAEQSAAVHDSTVSTLLDRLQNLHGEVSELSIQLRSARDERELVEERLNEERAHRVAAEEQLAYERGRIDAVERGRDEAEQRARLLQDEIREVAERLRSVYGERETLEAQLAYLPERISVIEAQRDAAEECARSLRSELLDVRSEMERTSSLLAEQSAFLEQARAQHAEVLEESQFYAAAAESSKSALRDTRAQLWAARRSIDQLELQVTKGSNYVTDLLRQLEEKEAQIAGGGDYARELEAKLADAEGRMELLLAEVEAVRNAAISDKMVMSEYVDSLRAQVAEIPLLRETHGHLVAQTEELIASIQKESAQIVTLIDTVQTSHFWKIKRFLNRARARLLRR